MPKEFKHFTLEFGEEHVPHTYNLEDDPGYVLIINNLA